jgi:acyl phosphate:glycerol-3-phosphate acyltransferase
LVLLDYIIKILLAYLLGSVLGSLVIGKLRGGIDIRNVGSGNAGGTNALRTQGVWFALGVMLIDVGKGYLAAAILPTLFHLQEQQLHTPSSYWLPIACSATVVLGHVYPIWFGFRGGKGAATLIGVVLGLHPAAAIPVMAVWLSVLLLSGFVGLATMLATVSFPLLAKWWLHSDALAGFGMAMVLLVLFTHRGNIARMRSGTEHRSQRFWLLRPR